MKNYYQFEKDKLKLSETYYNNNIKRENSIISRIFYSQIISTYTCEFNNKVYEVHNILDISLLLPDKKEYRKTRNSSNFFFITGSFGKIRTILCFLILKKILIYSYFSTFY